MFSRLVHNHTLSEKRNRPQNLPTNLESWQAISHNALGYAQLGEKFRPPAWPLKSVFIKAKLRMFSRIPNAEWPSSFARLRKATVIRQAALRSESTLELRSVRTLEKTGRVVANGESPRPLVQKMLKRRKNNHRTHLLKNLFRSAVVRLIKKNRNPKMKKQTLRTILSRWIRREAGDQISKLEWQISISKCCSLSRQARRPEDAE